MTRVVVDTNVFVSLLIRPGSTFGVFIDYIDQHATILYSDETLTELVDVLRRRKFEKYTSPDEVTDLVKWIALSGEHIISDVPVTTRSRDPKDDKFLSVAVAGRADYLVSGDKDLLILGQVGGIPIVSPSKFLLVVDQMV